MTDCEPLKNKSTLVEDICNIIIDQMVELIEHELKRNDIDFEINYKNVMGLKEELKKNKEIKSKVIFNGDDLESAVGGLIKYHENKIEDYIKTMTTMDFNFAECYDNVMIDNLWRAIKKEYNAIMSIQHWLEDAI